MATLARTPIAAAVFAALALAGCGSERVDRGSDPGPTAAGLGDGVLLTADELPTRKRLTAWEQTPPYDGATLACQAEPLGALGALGANEVLTREFGAYIADTPEARRDGYSSLVHTAVLQFADPAQAGVAYSKIANQVAECELRVDEAWPHAGTLGSSGSGSGSPDGTRSEWIRRDFHAPDVCTDCDAVRFARMGHAQIGDRLVLAQLAEVGGPLEPAGLDRTMNRLMQAAIDQAGPGGR